MHTSPTIGPRNIGRPRQSLAYVTVTPMLSITVHATANVTADSSASVTVHLQERFNQKGVGDDIPTFYTPINGPHKLIVHTQISDADATDAARKNEQSPKFRGPQIK